MSDFDKSYEALICGHCGEKNRMATIGRVHDTTEDSGVESGTCYELHSCPNCGKLVLSSSYWNDMMEGPEDTSASVVLPEARDRAARNLLVTRDLDIECMVRAVDEARQSATKDGSHKPRVGAVVARAGRMIASAHRGELKKGDHAEYTLLEGKCATEILAGATVFTTLEPCTTRSAPKVPCLERLIARKIARVVIGMLDPDERIRGRGVLALRKANIQVDLFPPDLMTQLEELNREFIADRETNEVGTINSPVGSASVTGGGGSADRVRQSVVSLAKHLRSVLTKLPNGSAESIQRADRLLREAVLPEGDALSELRRNTGEVGTSVAELGIAVVENVGWLLRLARDVQATPRERGFDYQRVNWKEWTFRWAEADKALAALIVI